MGRTKTSPDHDDDVSSIGLAVFSCSNYPNGYFNAYGNAARKDNVDFFVRKKRLLIVVVVVNMGNRFILVIIYMNMRKERSERTKELQVHRRKSLAYMVRFEDAVFSLTTNV